MKFQPSGNFSSYGCAYGCGHGCSHGYGDDAASETEAQKEEEGGMDAAGYVNLIGAVYNQLFGEDEDDRLDAAAIQAKLYAAQQSKKRGDPKPITGWLSGGSASQYWDQQIQKYTAQLAAANELAGEARAESQLNLARNAAYTLAAVAGVAVLGGIALNQIQKARLQQLEIAARAKQTGAE